MEILKISNSCSNCDNLIEDSHCKVHNLHVSDKYTCDSFDIGSAL